MCRCSLNFILKSESLQKLRTFSALTLSNPHFEFIRSWGCDDILAERLSSEVAIRPNDAVDDAVGLVPVAHAAALKTLK